MNHLIKNRSQGKLEELFSEMSQIWHKLSIAKFLVTKNMRLRIEQTTSRYIIAQFILIKQPFILPINIIYQHLIMTCQRRRKYEVLRKLPHMVSVNQSLNKIDRVQRYKNIILFFDKQVPTIKCHNMIFTELACAFYLSLFISGNKPDQLLFRCNGLQIHKLTGYGSMLLTAL